MKKRFLYIFLVMLMCLALPGLTLAQGPPDPQDTPIDGGLLVLLAAGTAYGVKKYRQDKNVKESRFELK